MKNFHSVFSHNVDYGYYFLIEPLLFFLDENWLRYAHLYFTFFIFCVLVITKQQKNGSRSINAKKYYNFFLLYFRVWILLPYIAFDIYSWSNIYLYMLISILHYSDSVSGWVNTEQQENSTSSKYIELPKYVSSVFRVWILLSHIYFDNFIRSY